jgi:hypothetical protein
MKLLLYCVIGFFEFSVSCRKTCSLMQRWGENGRGAGAEAGGELHRYSRLLEAGVVCGGVLVLLTRVESTTTTCRLCSF